MVELREFVQYWKIAMLYILLDHDQHIMKSYLYETIEKEVLSSISKKLIHICSSPLPYLCHHETQESDSYATGIQYVALEL